MSLPNCPQCDSEYTYEMGNVYVCPMCNYEWNEASESANAVKNAHGNVLNDGITLLLLRI